MSLCKKDYVKDFPGLSRHFISCKAEAPSPLPRQVQSPFSVDHGKPTLSPQMGFLRSGVSPFDEVARFGGPRQGNSRTRSTPHRPTVRTGWSLLHPLSMSRHRAPGRRQPLGPGNRLMDRRIYALQHLLAHPRPDLGAIQHSDQCEAV